MMRRLTRLGFITVLVTGCTLATFTKTSNDAIACAIAIAAEVQAGVADPAFQALGHSPTATDIATALQHVQTMVPATIVACAPLAADFSLASTTPGPLGPPTPPVKAEGGIIKVPNPWKR